MSSSMSSSISCNSGYEFTQNIGAMRFWTFLICDRTNYVNCQYQNVLAGDYNPINQLDTASEDVCFTPNDVCAHCCQPNLNGCEARLTPYEWFSYQVWNRSALDRFKVNLKKRFGGANKLQICENVQCDHPVLGCGWLQQGKTQLRCAACGDLRESVANMEKARTQAGAKGARNVAGGGRMLSGAKAVVGCGNDLRYANKSRTEQFSEFFES